MPLNGHKFDPYFKYAKRGFAWVDTLYGVTVESVTCECGYRPRRETIDPRKAFTAHRRKYHRAQYYMERMPLVIQEEPDHEAEVARLREQAGV